MSIFNVHYLLAFVLVLSAAQVFSQSEATPALNPVEDPCDLLTPKKLTSIYGIKTASEGRANLANSETWRICDFIVDKRNMSVSLKRHSDRIIERKGLERSYQSTLEIKDKFSRTEVDGAPGDQTIFIHGQKGPIYSYSLQWRYANHTEGMIAISFPKKQKADEVLRKLKAIAALLDESH